MSEMKLLKLMNDAGFTELEIKALERMLVKCKEQYDSTQTDAKTAINECVNLVVKDENQ